MNSKSKTKFYRLVRALRAAMLKGRYPIDAVIGSALAAWCKESFPGLRPARLPRTAAIRKDATVRAFVDFVKSHELLEATYWFSSAYAQLLGDQVRKESAMFFTPPSLTRGLLDDLADSGVDFTKRRFCDPACGGAAFLVPIALRMRDDLRSRKLPARRIIGHVQEHLLGFEQDSILCELSRQFLKMVLHDETKACGVPLHPHVVQGDSLRETVDLFGTLDVVVCNPPFRKMAASEVTGYAEEFEDVIEGQPNLYALFIALCVRLLARGGTCALVTPTSFLSGQNFSQLRKFLLSQTTIRHIGMVSQRVRVFIDVEQETALTIARRESNGHSPAAEADVSVVSRDGAYTAVGKCLLPNSGAAWPIPRTEDDVALLKGAAVTSATLVDYGYVARVGAFVWNRDTRETYLSAKEVARAREKRAVPLLWSSDIGPNGKLKFSGESKTNNEGRFVNLGAKDHRSVVRNPSVLLQRVTSNDQPLRLIAAPISKAFIDEHGGFVGENHTVILEQTDPRAALSPRQMAALLGTPTVDRYFRCISGATNVSVFELNQLRLPDPVRLKKLLAETGDMAHAVSLAMRDK